MAKRGTVLGGRYRLVDVLGDGGMARVFRAEDQRLNRVVAVKVLHQQYLNQPEFVRRFEQEAQLAAGLSHPNIVAIFDVGREDDTYFIVMEYVEGSSLKAVITREAPLPLDRTITITRQIGLALDYAHAHGVIHRDIKPENILLTRANHVKVSDFGIARALTSPGQTATGMVLGSVSYFSPEQAQGKPATAESDLYSAGIVLYEMLTGRLPFAADNPLATAMQHITQQPAPPRSFVPSLPASVDTVVMKSLHKNPAARYRSGAALADALTVAAVGSTGRAAGGGAGTSRAAPPVHAARTMLVPPPAPPRRRGAAMPVVLVLLLGGAGAFAYTHQHDIQSFLAGGAGAAAPNTPSPTASPTAGEPSPQATTPGVVAAASATPVPPTATARIVTDTPTQTAGAPAAATTPAATASATVTPTPTATTTATPSASATATGPGHLSAAIVTTSNVAYDANGAPIAVGTQDTFPLSAGAVDAVIHIDHYPKGARVGALWTFPNGKKIPYYIKDKYPTYYVTTDLSTPGVYSVSALVGKQVVGAHQFKVTGNTVTPHTAPGTPGSAPTVVSSPQGVALAILIDGRRARGHAYGRRLHRGRGRGAGLGIG